MTREQRKQEFIYQLAKFCVDEQWAKSIQLEMESRNPKPPPMVNFAKEWAALRQSTPLHGAPNYDEAVKVLTEFLK